MNRHYRVGRRYQPQARQGGGNINAARRFSLVRVECQRVDKDLKRSVQQRGMYFEWRQRTGNRVRDLHRCQDMFVEASKPF